MAIWNKNNIMLTKNGASVLSKVQSGQGYLTITRAVASSQVVLVDNLSEVETLNPENLELAIIGRRESGDGGSIILLQLSNLHLEQSFQLNEIGIFATHSEDPDNEFLYIIAQVDTGTGDRVPSYDITPVTATYDFYLYNLKSGDVTFEVSATGLATVAQMNEAVSGLERKDTELETRISENAKAIEELDTQGVSEAINALNIPLIRSRVSQIEREQANIALQMEAEGMMPDCNMLLAENFDGVIDDTNRTKIKVISAVSGDDSVDVETVYNLRIGDWVWVSDGLHSEYRQIKSTIKNGGVYRVILTSVLNETYVLDDTYIYFTTCDIDNGICMGSTDILSKKYTGETWSGSKKGGTATSNVKLDTSLDNADNFAVDGVTFDGNNLATLS